MKDADKSRESAAECQRAPGMKDKCAWREGGELRDPGSERDAEKEQKRAQFERGHKKGSTWRERGHTRVG